MAKLKRGDMVRYVGGHHLNQTPTFIGSVGQVRTDESDEDSTIRVRFIRALSSDETMRMQGGDDGDWGCMIDNLEKIKLVRGRDNG